MMIDNDMPATLGFLKSYIQGKEGYSQSGDVPNVQVESEYAQELGGPLVSRTIRYTPQNAIIKAPHIDSPYMDQLIERGFKPMKPPGPKGPQLPSFL